MGGHRLNWQFEHLNYIRQQLREVTLGRVDRLAVACPPQHGKLLDHDTPIITPDGFRPHGDLRPGDRVCGSAGAWVDVVAVGNDDYATYEVAFTDGEVIRCHGRHEWTVWDRAHREMRTVETQEIALHKLWSGGRARYSVDWIPVVGDEKRLPVEPYTLGAWLGDGQSAQPRIVHASADRAVVAAVGKYYRQTAEYTHRTTGVVTASFDGGTGSGSPLWQALVNCGVAKNKHIPDVYFTASLRQRQLLLAGLMDTDGYIHHRTRRACFSSCNERLAENVAVLVRSFGWRATTARYDPVNCTLRSTGQRIVGRKPVYQVTFSPSGPIPCELDRKRTDGFKVVYRRRGIREIRRCEPRPGRCIQVASDDGLYLAGRGLVLTHNTHSITVRYPLYRMVRTPGLRVVVGTHSDGFAKKINRWTRNTRDLRHIPVGSVDRQDEFELANGSSWLVRPVGGRISGLPCDLAVIEDPYGSAEDARSAAYRRQVEDWYEEDILGRLSNKAAVIIVHTRWRPDDLIGTRLEHDVGQWSYHNLPAIALANDPIKRPVGAALCPELHTLEELNRKRDAMRDPAAWESLYQGNPRPRGGSFVQREWLILCEPAEVPWLQANQAVPTRIRAWDLAGTTGETSCYTSGVLMARHGNTFFVEDVVRGRWIPSERNAVIVQTARADMARPGFRKTWFEQEPGSSGIETAQRLAGQLAGMPCEADRVTGDKDTRMEPFADQCRLGNVRVLVGAWTGAFVSEVSSIPNGRYRDSGDSAGMCFAKLTAPQTVVKFVGW